MRTFFFLLAATVLASWASAEPMFLAKQYTRCTACHYSPTGGGLLTPYGRLLSHRELSTTGPTDAAPPSGDDDEDRRGEQAFLYGVLGNAPGSVHLGLEARPSHLGIGFPGGHQEMDLLMISISSGRLRRTGGPHTAASVASRRIPPCGTAAACRTPRSSPTNTGFRFKQTGAFGFAPAGSSQPTVFGLPITPRTLARSSIWITTIRCTASS